MISKKDNRHGNNLALTDRDQLLISSVAEHGPLNRQQIARLCGFRSVTRVNTRLKRLVDARLLQRMFLPTATGSRLAVYRRASSSAESTWRGSPLLIQHALAVNDVRLAFECCRQPGYSFLQWTPEEVLRKFNLGLVPDGFVEYLVGDLRFSAFVEADLGTEALERWQLKVRGYLSLALRRYAEVFKRKFFRVFVVTSTLARLENLRRATKSLTSGVFWFCRLADVSQTDPFAAIWRRPDTSDLLTLDTGGRP